MNYYLILLQDTVWDGNYPLYFPLVVIPILVIAVAGHRIRKIMRRNRAGREYRDALERLKAEPDNPELKRETLALGTRYADLSKTAFGRSAFDEIRLENDMNSVSGKNGKDPGRKSGAA
jgi:hypothetical protein